MPLTDDFMLPRRVRTMEQMADLLQAEEAEINQAQRTIDAMAAQLAVCTSTFLLPRHERIFGLPVNTGESLEVRRARVLARLNTRGVTTVQAIRELVQIITGREGEVTEHFAGYAFSVTVRLLFPDATKDLGELIRQIDEIKPAHLIFDTIGAVQPVVLENRNRLLFVSQSLRLRVSNLGEGAIYLDGRRSLDGSWLLDQALRHGLALQRMRVHLWQGNPLNSELGVLGVWCKILNLEKAAPAVGIKVGASSRILIQGPSFVRGSFHTAHANPQKESLLTTISTHVNSISQQWIGFLCGARFSNLTRAGLQNVRFAAKVRNAGGISASRTTDNMRRFDGSYQFDGSRKWNAKIERSDL